MIGYAVYFKDKDGYDIVLSSGGQILVFTSKEQAEESLQLEKEKAYNQFHAKNVITSKGHLFWKKTHHEYVQPNEVDLFVGKQIYTTIGIKKVKVV